MICKVCGQECHKWRKGDESLCRRCHDSKMRRLWRRATLKIANCTECGYERPSSLLEEAICQSCYTKRKNGIGRCRRCTKGKVIANLEHHLCKHCYGDLIAPENLRRYFDNYDSPFPQNSYYLALLSEAVVWDKVTEKTVRRFRAIGKFLYGYELPQPLTWEAIEGALPTLGTTKRYETKLVRSCLRDIGHLLADRGLLESWADYISRRRSLQPVEKLPACFKADLMKYREWLLYDRYSPSGTRSSLYSVTYFLIWCAGRGITSLSEVRALTVESYQQTLCWKWVCKICQHSTTFEPWRGTPPEGCVNQNCKVEGSYERKRRHSQAYIRTQISNLSTFFDWAGFHGLAQGNPVQCKIREDERKITHYSDQIYDQLSAYLKSPEADPEEALALYLIFFHAFKVKELCLAQLPSLTCQPEKRSALTLAEDYHLEIAPQPRSRANYAGRRPSLRIDFPPEASHWLKPILAKYAQYRAGFEGDSQNQYLFVSSRSVRHNQPASKEHIRRLVMKATRRVLGAAANASTLRRTTGVIFTDECPRRGAVLTHLGWGSQRANNYTYMKRRVVHPRG